MSSVDLIANRPVAASRGESTVYDLRGEREPRKRRLGKPGSHPQARGAGSPGIPSAFSSASRVGVESFCSDPSSDSCGNRLTSLLSPRSLGEGVTDSFSRPSSLPPRVAGGVMEGIASSLLPAISSRTCRPLRLLWPPSARARWWRPYSSRTLSRTT